MQLYAFTFSEPAEEPGQEPPALISGTFPDSESTDFTDVRGTSAGICAVRAELLPEGFSRGSSGNPVCKSQPIDAVVELGWD